MPSRPDFLLRTSSISRGVRCSFSIIKVTTEGSRVPVRLPIIKPSRGVRPMLVSMTLPFSMAVMEDPLPRWQVIIFRSFKSLPISWAQRWLTYRWEVPWKP